MKEENFRGNFYYTVLTKIWDFWNLHYNISFFYQSVISFYIALFVVIVTLYNEKKNQSFQKTISMFVLYMRQEFIWFYHETSVS